MRAPTHVSFYFNTCSGWRRSGERKLLGLSFRFEGWKTDLQHMEETIIRTGASADYKGGNKFP